MATNNDPKTTKNAKIKPAFEDKIVIFDVENKSQERTRFETLNEGPLIADSSLLHLPNISKISHHDASHSLIASNVFTTQLHGINSLTDDSTADLIPNKHTLSYPKRDSLLKLMSLNKHKISSLHPEEDTRLPRKRTFEINPQTLIKPESKYSGHIYALGIIKYELSVFRDAKSQYLIISDQMGVLSEKVASLLFHTEKRGETQIKQLYEYVNYEQ